MGDTTMSAATSGDGDHGRDDGNQRESYMIPGVDGRLSFGFPKKIITTIRYVGINTQTSASGVVSTHIYRMNGIQDPDLTGIGHQPMWFDNYAAIYQNYRVLGSRITVEWMPQLYNDDTTGPWNIGIIGSPTSSSQGSDPETRSELNDSVADVMTSRDGVRTLSFAFSPEIHLGRPAGDDTVGALVTTLPTQQYFAHVWMEDIKGSATASLLYHKATIEYTVEFFALQIQASN